MESQSSSLYTQTIAMSKKLRYYVYIRKSEERQERQLLSLHAQLREIQTRFPDIEIVGKPIEESTSAFKPNNRPLFARMLKDIDLGKAEGIISYHPNRLSRNEKDASEITYRLRDRSSNLQDLKFVNYTFSNTPEGIMMLQMVLSQSQYESSKQGVDVARGMKQKIIDKKERPGQVPLGYIKRPVLDSSGRLIQNKDKILTETVLDPERHELVAKIWTMFLSGLYTTGEIRRIANEEWKLRSRSYRTGGSIPIGSSSLYRILNNPFYAGVIRHNGEEFEGGHETMITIDEFDYAQKLLGKRGKPRLNVNDYSFTGLIKCGKCGCSVVGKTRDKTLATGKVVTYVYYYCTRKSEKRPCDQKKYTPLAKIEEEINEEIAKFTILPEFKQLALDIIRRNHKLEVKDRNAIYRNQQSSREQLQARLDKLVDMRTGGLLTDDEYIQQRDRIRLELDKVHSGIDSTERRAKDWLGLTEKAFEFATSAKEAFANGDTKVKRDILMTLGETLILLDQKLYIEPSAWLVPLKEQYPAIEKKYLKAGTNKKASSKKLDEALMSIFDTWRARWGLNPRHPA